jgi:Family of unknown function (DUF6069)
MATGRITRARGEVATHPVRRQRLLTVAGGTLGALAVWAVAEWVVGLDLRMPAFSSGQQPQELKAAAVAVASAVGGLAGWAVLAVLERFSTKADRVWIAVAPIALLASMGTPLSGHGVSAGDRMALIGMHLAVAAVVIPFLYRSSASRRDRTAA